MLTPDQTIPDPRCYWFRAHQRAARRVARSCAAYERAWRSGQPAMREWEQLKAARRCAAFVYARLAAAVMGW